MADITAPAAADDAAPIDLGNLVWMAAAFVALAGVVRLDNLWLLNFVHVISGVMWTGIDLFMGFVVGPIVRAMPLPARRAFVLRLTPKTLFLLPTLSILTTTAGWFLALRLGFLALPYPAFWWVAAALAIVTVLTIQGLGFLLPTNLMVYFELRKERPDPVRIGRLMRWYFAVIAVQGTMQVAIIVVMARLATGV